MQKEQRVFPRFPSRTQVTATVALNDTALIGAPIDISQTGAYIASVKPSPGDAEIKFEIPDQGLTGKQSIERECFVFPDRFGKSGGCAVKFHTPLTGEELAFLTEASQVGDSLELAREDYQIVSSEVSRIHSCRSQIFMGTMAAVTAWVIAAVGIGVTNDLESPIWIAIGVSFPQVLLTIAILATLEKANVLNMRKGFLAALTDYLRNNSAPPNYRGWAHLRVNRAECRSRYNNELCPFPKKACWEQEKAQGFYVTTKHHLMTNIFDSFGAFVSYVYACLYTLSSALIIGVGISYWMHFKDKWPGLILAITILVGVLVTIIALFLFFQLRALRRGKKTPESYYFEWRAIFRYCRSIHGKEQPIVRDQKSPRLTSPSSSPQMILSETDGTPHVTQ